MFGEGDRRLDTRARQAKHASEVTGLRRAFERAPKRAREAETWYGGVMLTIAGGVLLGLLGFVVLLGWLSGSSGRPLSGKAVDAAWERWKRGGGK